MNSRSRPGGHDDSHPRRRAAARYRLVGLARASDQRVHIGPETLPLLALLGRNAGEGTVVADPREVANAPPVLHPRPDLGPGLLPLTPVERLAPPREVQAQPNQGLPAPACAFHVVQIGRVFAL